MNIRITALFLCIAIAALCCLAAYLVVLHFRMDDGIMGLVSVSSGILRRRIAVFSSWLTYGWWACILLLFLLAQFSVRRSSFLPVLAWMVFGLVILVWLSVSLMPARDMFIVSLRVLEAKPYIVLLSAPALLLLVAYFTDIFARD